ncbi:gamma-tubulin complex component 3 homolog [Diorhabda sublineata]|uniref:gamma-tubulin complex component 3 homolog n=1 Tax=Diorhabda sublineata TaxID=1163346 RepID=UPI0024E0D0EE|nr:gamma-tubulin complex component 3 homolog [Diorhabda sublineata]
MDVSESIENSGVSDLIVKLCNNLSKNNQGIASDLCKVAFSFLSTVPATFETNNIHEESYTVSQIRQKLASQSKEKLDKFEILYSKLCESTILQRRSASLSFLYQLSNGVVKSSKDGVPAWCSVSKELGKLKSQTSLTQSNSQDSVRNFFESKDKKKGSSGSHSGHSGSLSATRAHSQTTTISSYWSRNDLPGSSKIISLTTVTEQDLLLDVIYSFQGIEGKFLRKEPGGLGFTIDPKACKLLTPFQKGILERLTGMSFLHNQLKRYCEENEKQRGIISQALIATLSDELSEYYKTVALLQASISKQGTENLEMTLKRALYVMYDPHTRFEWLAYISEQCSDKKGGELITAIHGFLQHGSKCAREVSETVLKSVCKPLYVMLSRWLLDGEINDPYNEFFVEAKNVITAERLWHDKYKVRYQMVPSFITMNQAKKILATGKSINFLRQICRDGGQLPGRESLHKLFKNSTAEALFAPEQSIEFHATLENVYKETSIRVLDLLKNKYKLYEHLQSLRRYLLLGQGDFIRHLLELLEPELNKDAEHIYGHTLSAILESAIRVTNAQYEDEDTLKRLNVSFMSHSSGDTGWDVFSLMYIVDGPIGTIFQHTMPTYQSLFGALWKAKRTEYALANMRRQQICMAKLFRKIRELKPVMHSIHILTSKMIHFLHQTQYYFLFEVLECSWAEMQHQVNKADSLDDIITAHAGFLNSVQRGVLLDENSRQLFSHLVSIYNFVMTLECHQEALYRECLSEHEAYTEYQKKINGGDGFGTNTQDDNANKLRRSTFHHFLNTTKVKVKTSSETYDLIVKNFLELLSKSVNMNLRLLSVRLSFNNFYKVA